VVADCYSGERLLLGFASILTLVGEFVPTLSSVLAAGRQTPGWSTSATTPPLPPPSSASTSPSPTALSPNFPPPSSTLYLSLPFHTLSGDKFDGFPAIPDETA
jgi:hypothetical protein